MSFGLAPSCAPSSARLFAVTLLIFAFSTLTGCTSVKLTANSGPAITVTGNWQFASTAASAAKLPALSGELTGTSAALTGILHSDAATSCISPFSSFEVTGSTNAQGITTITSSNLAGGTFTLTGTLAANGKSFSAATYTVSGGTCAFSAPALATADAFSPINGSYNGTFYDASGEVLNMTAALSQSPASDADGNFLLTGTGTFSNPCFTSPATVSNTQVTGGSFTLTYADPSTLNSVTLSGTFATNGQTLTITNWTLTGPCGPDSGYGSLVQP
jgi:hypothetical protein